MSSTGPQGGGKRRARLLGAAALLLACTSAQSATCTTHAYAAIALDVATTQIALNQPGVHEVNPLYGKDPAFAALALGGLVRAAGVYLLDRAGADTWVCILARGTYAIAISNAAVAAGARTAPALAIGFGITLAFW